MAVIRDFSDDMLQKLWGYVEESEGWLEDNIGDWFIGLFRNKKIEEDLSDLASYQRDLIDYQDMSRDEIENIFLEARGIDSNYGKVFLQNTESADNYNNILSVLAKSISAGGSPKFVDIKKITNDTRKYYDNLLFIQWERILNKNADDITETEYRKVAEFLASTYDPKIVEKIINKCYIPEITYLSQDTGTCVTAWKPDAKLAKIKEYMDLYADILMKLDYSFSGDLISDEARSEFIDKFNNLLQKIELIDYLNYYSEEYVDKYTHDGQIATNGADLYNNNYDNAIININCLNNNYEISFNTISYSTSENNNYLGRIVGFGNDYDYDALKDLNPDHEKKTLNFDNKYAQNMAPNVQTYNTTETKITVGTPIIGETSSIDIDKKINYYMKSNFSSSALKNIGENSLKEIVSEALDWLVPDKFKDAVDIASKAIEIANEIKGSNENNDTANGMCDMNSLQHIITVFNFQCTSGSVSGSIDVADWHYTLYPTTKNTSDDIPTQEAIDNLNSFAEEYGIHYDGQICEFTMEELLNDPMGAYKKLEVYNEKIQNKGFNVDIANIADGKYNKDK